MSESHHHTEAIGTVSHYFSHVSVAAVSLNAQLSVGERIHIRGHTTDLIQTVETMEIERQRVDRAGPGDDVAIGVGDHVREHDEIFREA